MTFVVIGGAGAMGRITVRDLLETSSPDSQIVIADYNIEAARQLVSTLSSRRIASIRMDVRDVQKTASGLKGAAVVINCSDYHFNVGVMKAALQAGVNYVDLGGLFHVTREQLKLDAEYKAAGLTAIIGMGAAPGISNLLARRAADRLESVQEIHVRVGSIDRTRYDGRPLLPISYSINTILEEFSLKPAVFSRGRMRFVEPMSGAEPHEFPRPVGKQLPMYTLHSEVATLPASYKAKRIREVSFKIAFDPEFVARVKFMLDLGLGSREPMEVGGQKVIPVDVVKALVAAQTKPKLIGELRQYEVVRAVVKGTAGGKRVTHIVDCHTAGMPEWGIGLDIDTGAPPSIVAQMLAQGMIAEKGVLPPEGAVAESYFFKELRKRRMRIKEAIRNGWAFKA
jgi:saccharopine dehydrogenase-like NADP-dependent oxidoreductase